MATSLTRHDASARLRLRLPGARATAVLIGLAWLALVLWARLGFLGSDDVIYVRGAQGWLAHFPFVGGHGTIRYPITVPMALSFELFGENEFAMVLPSFLYLVGLLWLAWQAVARAVRPTAANCALLLLATTPLLVSLATIANIDVIETFFLFVSFALYLRTLRPEPSLRMLFLSGAAVGAAFLARETAVFMAAFYGVLFLAGHGFRRRYYWMIAAGFLAVWAVELLYLGVMTGDPLYRFNIAMNHDSTIDRSVDLAGNLLVHPAIDPLLVLLVNQEFMLLFWLAIPAGVWLCVGRGVAPATRHFARLTALLGTLWFLCVAAAVTLLPLNPRYFLVTTVAAALLLGLAFDALWRQGGHRRAAGIVLAILLATNLLGVFVENRDSMFPARQLTAIAEANPGGPIHTDPNSRHRAELLLEWAGAADRVIAEPPGPGDWFVRNPGSGSGPLDRPTGFPADAFEPKPDWQLVARYQPQPDPVVLAAEALGLPRLMPERLWRKLRHRHQGVELYRVDTARAKGPIEATGRGASRRRLKHPAFDARQRIADRAAASLPGP